MMPSAVIASLVTVTIIVLGVLAIFFRINEAREQSLRLLISIKLGFLKVLEIRISIRPTSKSQI